MRTRATTTFDVLLPAHQIGQGGLGTSIRGICDHLPAHLPPGCRLTAIGAPSDFVSHAAQSPEIHRGTLNGGTKWKVHRHVHEQVTVAIAARDFDLLHLCDSRPVLASRTPFFLTIYDVFYLDHPSWFPRPVRLFKEAMLKAALKKRPVRIVAGSHYTRSRLLERLPAMYEDVTDVVYPGLDPVQPRQKVHRNEYFLTVSTIEPRKNHLTLLAAHRRARSAGMKLKWVIAGAAGYAADDIVSALARADGVEYRGKVTDIELEELYAGASFVVIPSHAEGFGFPTLEAMQRGVPVACSRGSAFDETVGDAALKLDADDVDGWADALQQLSDDNSLVATLVRRGHERVTEFTWDKAARNYAAFYSKCINALA